MPALFTIIAGLLGLYFCSFLDDTYWEIEGSRQSHTSYRRGIEDMEGLHLLGKIDLQS
ncbi:MAG: hypothetical protein ACJ72S_15930 [Nitrososphaeraceae archaeon]